MRVAVLLLALVILVCVDLGSAGRTRGRARGKDRKGGKSSITDNSDYTEGWTDKGKKNDGDSDPLSREDAKGRGRGRKGGKSSVTDNSEDTEGWRGRGRKGGKSSITDDSGEGEATEKGRGRKGGKGYSKTDTLGESDELGKGSGQKGGKFSKTGKFGETAEEWTGKGGESSFTENSGETEGSAGTSRKNKFRKPGWISRASSDEERTGKGSESSFTENSGETEGSAGKNKFGRPSWFSRTSSDEEKDNEDLDSYEQALDNMESHDHSDMPNPDRPSENEPLFPELERRCEMGRCECEDHQVKGQLLAEVSNVVSKCVNINLQAAMIRLQPTKESAPKSKETPKEMEFYLAACTFLGKTKEEMEKGTYQRKPRSCAEYDQLMLDFVCLNAYMSLAETRMLMKKLHKLQTLAAASNNQENDGDEETSACLGQGEKMLALEKKVRDHCNRLYISPESLVAGLTGASTQKPCTGDKGPDGDGKPPRPVAWESDETENEVPDIAIQPRIFGRIKQKFMFGFSRIFG